MKKKIIFVILFIAVCTSTAMIIFSMNDSVEALSKYGSRGSEVTTIQQKLKRWGYYNGSIDGIYGSQTVAAVVLNRVKSSSFPNTISGVIYQSGAFDAVSDGQINMTPDSTAKKAAQDALNGWDPSYGAIYYFNPSTATNKWIWSRPMTVTIGKHRFCK